MTKRKIYKGAFGWRDMKKELRPVLTGLGDVIEAIDVRVGDTSVEVYLAGEHFVSYSGGNETDFESEKLYMNPGVFNGNTQKRVETYSATKNLGKSFFIYNGRNHVLLVQYMDQMQESSKHWHQKDEGIAQLVGSSVINLDGEDHVLMQGEILRIPAGITHQVRTPYGESLTVPFKETRRKCDHFYPERDAGEILRQVRGIRMNATAAGISHRESIENYLGGLSDTEKITYNKIVSNPEVFELTSKERRNLPIIN